MYMMYICIYIYIERERQRERETERQREREREKEREIELFTKGEPFNIVSFKLSFFSNLKNFFRQCWCSFPFNLNI